MAQPKPLTLEQVIELKHEEIEKFNETLRIYKKQNRAKFDIKRPEYAKKLKKLNDELEALEAQLKPKSKKEVSKDESDETDESEE